MSFTLMRATALAGRREIPVQARGENRLNLAGAFVAELPAVLPTLFFALRDALRGRRTTAAKTNRGDVLSLRDRRAECDEKGKDGEG
jgi:hypothetical protein